MRSARAEGSKGEGQGRGSARGIGRPHLEHEGLGVLEGGLVPQAIAVQLVLDDGVLLHTHQVLHLLAAHTPRGKEWGRQGTSTRCYRNEGATRKKVQQEGALSLLRGEASCVHNTALTTTLSTMPSTTHCGAHSIAHTPTLSAISSITHCSAHRRTQRNAQRSSTHQHTKQQHSATSLTRCGTWPRC